MGNKLIEIKNASREYEIYTGFVKKRKKIIQALKNVSFTVKKGEIFGLLGPNGAGKTTMIKILTTLLLPTTGNVKIFGLDVAQEPFEIRHRINCLFGGERSLYWRLSAEDNLKYFADIYKIPNHIQNKRIPQLLEMVQLVDWKQTRVENFSKGMKQRLQIARCLINDPEIIFFDEPTIGLDPKGSIELRKLILDLKELQKTIILTTHYMYEAEELCDRTAFINQGEIIDIDTINQLKAKVQDMVTIVIKCKFINSRIVNRLEKLEFVNRIQVSEDNHGFNLELLVDQNTNGGDLFPYITEMGVTDIFTRDLNLEDVYMKLVVS